MTGNFFTDDDGIPTGSISWASINADAAALAVQIAAACDEADAVDRVLLEAMAAAGPAKFRLVSNAALRYLAVEILAPALAVETDDEAESADASEVT